MKRYSRTFPDMTVEGYELPTIQEDEFGEFVKYEDYAELRDAVVEMFTSRGFSMMGVRKLRMILMKQGERILPALARSETGLPQMGPKD